MPKIERAANLLADKIIKGAYEGGGWSWHLEVPSALNHEYPDIYSSYMACLGLKAWMDAKISEKDKIKKAKKCCVDTVDWIMDTGDTQSKQGIWAEYGSIGRHRYLDLILAMSILIEHGDDSTLSDDGSIVFQGLDELVFNKNTSSHLAGEYHRFQSDSLNTQIVMEELGGPYFELLLWGSLFDRFIDAKRKEQTESNTRAQKREKRFISEMVEYCHSSSVKFNLFSLVDDIISRRDTENIKENGDDNEWCYLWEKNEKRFYLTGLATLSLALVRKTYVQFKEEYSDYEYILQSEIASTLRSSRFSGQFAAQVLRSFSKRTLSK